MREGKENAKAQASDIAEAAPDESSVAVSPELAERIKAQVGDYSGEILITDDQNVFLKSNENEAIKHASKQGLKLFRIQWPV